MIDRFRLGALLVAVFGCCVVGQWATYAQPAKLLEARLAKPGTRLSFEVVESFDAKYEGDTPGHMGRAGGLDETRPNVALGDSVFRGEAKAGTITGVLWSRAQGSLTMEFDPEPNQRIAVGDVMSLDLNPAAVTKKPE